MTSNDSRDSAFALGACAGPGCIYAYVRLPGMPRSYPALVSRRRRRHGNRVIRLTWHSLTLLAGDLIQHWREHCERTPLPQVITVHDGDAHVVCRFGDRNSPVYPLPADADGLYTVAGELWPWRVDPV